MMNNSLRLYSSCSELLLNTLAPVFHHMTASPTELRKQSRRLLVCDTENFTSRANSNMMVELVVPIKVLLDTLQRN